MSKRKTNSVQEYHTNTPSLNKKQTIRGSLSNKSHSNNSSNRVKYIYEFFLIFFVLFK